MNAPAYIAHEEQEKKNKKRGLVIAFYFHVALLVLALLPFMGGMMMPETSPKEEMSFITIDFSQQESSSNVESPKKKAKKVEKRKKKVEKPVKKTIPKPKPKPAPKVVTTPEPEPALETPTEVEEVAEDMVEEPVVEKTRGEVQPIEDPDPGTGEGEVEEVGTASDMGSDTETTSSGKADKGNGFGESAGEGIFNRKVIYRADVKKITRLSGKIVVELCINQDGRVVFAKPDTEASTIKDFDVIRKAVDLTTKYKFARDNSAPRKQCGKMTYVFEGAGR